jgi:hypothetical protein
LGQERSNRSSRSPALFAEGDFGRRGHPSRVPSGSRRSPLTGPGRAADRRASDRRKGRLCLRRATGPTLPCRLEGSASGGIVPETPRGHAENARHCIETRGKSPSTTPALSRDSGRLSGPKRGLLRADLPGLQAPCCSLQARTGRVRCGSLLAIHLFWQGDVILVSKPVSCPYMLWAILSIGTGTRIRPASTC